jgi:O-antigen ligase
MQHSVADRQSPDVGRVAEGAGPQLPQLGFTAQVLAVVLLAWLPVPVTAAFGPLAGWPAALALAAVAWLISRRASADTLLAGVVVGSVFTSSGLVTQASEYMPVVVAGLPLLTRSAVQVLRTRSRPALPPLPVTLAVGAYLVIAVAAAALSSDRRLSVTYVAGMFLVVALAYVVAPAALAGAASRRRLLVVVAMLALVSAASAGLLWLTGPIHAFDRPIGDYLPTQLTIRGHVTGLLVPRVAGVFGAPAPEAMVLVAGLAALLALRGTLSGVRRRLAVAAIVPIVLALLAGQSRTGWLMAGMAAGAVVAASAWSRRALDVQSFVVMTLFMVMSVLLFTNTVGSAITADVASRIQHQASGDDSSALVVRGGTGLSGRGALWSVSSQAIRARPLLGWGPGTDAAVISPRLTGAYRIYRGLSSHSTWFRTAVEMGLLGLLALIAVLLTTMFVMFRHLLAVDRRFLDPTLVAIAAAALGLLAGQFFETALFAGVAFGSLYWTLTIGLLASLPAGGTRPA